MNLKIAHVNFARGFRGGERQTLNLMMGLAEHDVDQTLVCRTGSELKRRSDAIGMNTVEVSHPLFGHFRSPPADIIHVHEARGAYWARIEQLIRNKRYIITRRIPNPISRSATSIYRNATCLCAVSKDVALRLASQTNRHVTTVLSSTTSHAVNPSLSSEIRGKLGGGPIIGHVGALCDHHKGQSVLIEAFHMLLADYPDAQLLLVGDGSDKARFQQLAKADPRIHFAGFQEDIGSWIAAMDVFCFPSREEGLGSSVLDAMSLGVPIVSSSVGGLPELIGSEERGILVAKHEAHDWHRAIVRALSDDPKRPWRLHNARQFSRGNGIATMTERYMEIYTEVQERALIQNRRSISNFGPLKD